MNMLNLGQKHVGQKNGNYFFCPKFFCHRCVSVRTSEQSHGSSKFCHIAFKLIVKQIYIRTGLESRLTFKSATAIPDLRPVDSKVSRDHSDDAFRQATMFPFLPTSLHTLDCPPD